MIQCPGCGDALTFILFFPLCEICYESLDSCPPHAPALFTITDFNYPLLKVWKKSGGSAWDKLIIKRLQSMNRCEIKPKYIIPIPQRFSRQWNMRGGSSQRFSQLLSKFFQVPILNALELKTEETERKATQSLLDRMIQENSFRVNSQARCIMGESVIVSDDFSTTGRTITDAIETLQSHHPKLITPLVLAARRFPSTVSAAD
ncbi:MAG: hypothetical protein KA715_13730 [Xanthomonadaceae bacterium]|nr:hypothetical protein [Xanthomonadaceae bacterium]